MIKCRVGMVLKAQLLFLGKLRQFGMMSVGPLKIPGSELTMG
jgi:hypothetical protein